MGCTGISAPVVVVVTGRTTAAGFSIFSAEWVAGKGEQWWMKKREGIATGDEEKQGAATTPVPSVLSR